MVDNCRLWERIGFWNKIAAFIYEVGIHWVCGELCGQRHMHTSFAMEWRSERLSSVSLKSFLQSTAASVCLF